MGKRILLAARYYSIEPLGILYLAGVVRDHPDWECKVVLVREFDFTPLYDAVRSWNPDVVGFQIWTGYHRQAFEACKEVRALGVPIVIGGPHATYFDHECAKHADWVIKGSGFGLFRNLLEGVLPRGVHFDKGGRSERFPMPDRDIVYEAYPELGQSPIKSIFASVGCPFKCTYCYAPSFNEMHGGFQLTVRPVDDVVAEALDIMRRWPLAMVYFQDDIFGYNTKWLEEFAVKWRTQVGVPFHCQIRLELANHSSGDRRLDLFREAGCSGITLAIESGNAFLRDQVLFRHMPGDIIEEGCRKILGRGMTLRTEQILAVPFSDAATDIATLGLNNRIDPTMAWTSILAPYGGTNMGTIATNFGLYLGNNDDLSESFFDRSVLRHVSGGPRDIEQIVSDLQLGPKEHALLQMKAVPDGEHSAAIVHHAKGGVGSIEYLDDAANARYCEDTVRLQRHFIWLAKMPEAEALARKILAVRKEVWSWESLGTVAEGHLLSCGRSREDLAGWRRELALQMNLEGVEQLPEPVALNPWYFACFPEGAGLARKAIQAGVFEGGFAQTEGVFGAMVRRHLFHYGLYQIEKGKDPIARIQ